MANGNERINPIKLTDHATNETYELDFSRESIAFMERQGFKIDDVLDFPVTNIPKLFYYAFRKNHRKLAQNQTDALLNKLGGLSPKMIQRLIELYNQAAMSNNIQDDEDIAKNAEMTVEMD